MKPFNPNNRDQQSDHARMVLAVILSIGILFLFHFLVDRPRQEAVRLEALKREKIAEIKKAEVTNPETKIVTRADALTRSGRLPIEGSEIKGSISLTGAVLDDLLLTQHFTSVERTENVALLNPKSAPHAYYVESGFIATDTNIAVPDASSVWRIKSGSAQKIIAGAAPVTLQWNNGAGVMFERDISLDNNYLFTITQRVVNNSGKEISVNPYTLAARQGFPIDFQGMFVQHEGPVSVLNGEGQEGSYKDLVKGDVEEQQNVTGWLGISDKYWLVAILPDPKQSFNARNLATQNLRGPMFQTDAVMPPLAVAPGQAAESIAHIYAGVKDVHVMKDYQEKYGFDALEYGIDFGMWFFLTKPMFYLLHWLADISGTIAAAILLITLVIRAAVYPLADKSFRSMAKMKIVAPAIKELQEKHKDNREKLQQEIFELYKRENVNPFSGCWPMLIQIPIFFSLYKVILISVELRHAPFWGWIKDLSAPDPTSVFNLFGVLPFTPPNALMIGAWPILFCLSMLFQQRISPPMTDRTQEILQKTFPYIVTLMLAHFSVGLVIYWTWSNVLGALQQYYILKKVGGEETSLIRGHSGRRKKKPQKETEALAADDKK